MKDGLYRVNYKGICAGFEIKNGNIKMKITKIQKGDYRFYRIENKEYPSVTSILSLLPKSGLIFWAVFKTIEFLKEKGTLSKSATSEAYGFHKRLLSSLAQQGTEIHTLIEEYAQKGKDSKHNSVKRFKDFQEQHNFVYTSSEQTVYDWEYYRTAGTLDLFGTVFDTPIVIDLKTSKEIRLSHKIQATVYKDMYCKLNNIDKKEIKSGVLLIPRDRVKKWDFHINSEKEEEDYRKIFRLLSILFQSLLKINEINLTNS